MRMKTGPQLKGRQVPPPHGKRSANQPEVLPVKMRGRAEAPTQGRTRNQPNTTAGSGMRAKIGGVTPDTYFANSRSNVHPKFDTKGKHD